MNFKKNDLNNLSFLYNNKINSEILSHLMIYCIFYNNLQHAKAILNQSNFNIYLIKK